MIRAELYRAERPVSAHNRDADVVTVAEWRWRVKAANGKIMADSAEGNGYTSERHALHGLLAVTRTVELATFSSKSGTTRPVQRTDLARPGRHWSGTYLLDDDGRPVVKFRVIR